LALVTGTAGNGDGTTRTNVSVSTINLYFTAGITRPAGLQAYRATHTVHSLTSFHQNGATISCTTRATS
jgi:hypothetical protein